MSIIVSPSLLSADFLHLAKDVEMVNESSADWFHLDIMDGVFRPEYFLRSTTRITNKESSPETVGCAFDDHSTRTLRGGFS